MSDDKPEATPLPDRLSTIQSIIDNVARNTATSSALRFQIFTSGFWQIVCHGTVCVFGNAIDDSTVSSINSWAINTMNGQPMYYQDRKGTNE